MRKEVIISLIGVLMAIACTSNTQDVKEPSTKNKTQSKSIVNQAKPEGVVEIKSRAGKTYNILSTRDLDEMMSIENPRWHAVVLGSLGLSSTAKQVRAYKYALEYCMSKDYDFSKMSWFKCWTKEEQYKYINELQFSYMDDVIDWIEIDKKDMLKGEKRMAETNKAVLDFRKKMKEKYRDCERKTK